MTTKVFLIALAVIGTFATGCSDKAQTSTESPFVISDSLLRTLTIDTAEVCPMVNSLTLTGKVSYNEENIARIFPLVSGVISDVKVQLGDYVQKGEMLGMIRSSEMAGYANDLASAKAGEASAKKTLNASEEMFKTGLISETELVNARSQYEQAQSQLTKAEHVLQINGGNTQSEYFIKAPVSGFVVDKQVTNNMSIRNDNSTALFTISDLKNVWIWANVYESNITNVHLDDEVTVTTLAYPGKKFSGKIDKVLNVLDPTNKVMKIRVVLSNPGYLLKPEMFASITVAIKTGEQCLCLPSSSLVFDNSEYYVLVYKNQKDVRITPVQVVGKTEDKTYISGDVKLGDKIVGSNTILIYQALNY
jgi:cobalt-zinc-cadmium efflux system membrane fusion protein